MRMRLLLGSSLLLLLFPIVVYAQVRRNFLPLVQKERVTGCASVVGGIVQSDAITPSFVSPRANVKVVDNASFIVSVSSPYEITKVCVETNDQIELLSFSETPQCTPPQECLFGWVGSLSVQRYPFGNVRFTATALDIFGNYGQATVSISHDALPSVVIEKPRLGSVVQNSVPVKATCVDDDPSGCPFLRLNIRSEDRTVLTGLADSNGSISGTYTFRPEHGEMPELVFAGKDSGGQEVRETRRFYIERSTKIVELEAVAEPDWAKVTLDDRQENNGWVAYTVLGGSGQSQVWLRTPSGDERQITFFSTSSHIETLAPNGDITTISQNRRYLTRLGSSIVDVSSYFKGRSDSYFQNGKWFVVIGGTLFSIAP